MVGWIPMSEVNFVQVLSYAAVTSGATILVRLMNIRMQIGLHAWQRRKIGLHAWQRRKIEECPTFSRCGST